MCVGGQGGADGTQHDTGRERPAPDRDPVAEWERRRTAATSLGEALPQRRLVIARFRSRSRLSCFGRYVTAIPDGHVTYCGVHVIQTTHPPDLCTFRSTE